MMTYTYLYIFILFECVKCADKQNKKLNRKGLSLVSYSDTDSDGEEDNFEVTQTNKVESQTELESAQSTQLYAPQPLQYIIQPQPQTHQPITHTQYYGPQEYPGYIVHDPGYQHYQQYQAYVLPAQQQPVPFQQTMPQQIQQYVPITQPHQQIQYYVDQSQLPIQQPIPVQYVHPPQAIPISQPYQQQLVHYVPVSEPIPHAVPEQSIHYGPTQVVQPQYHGTGQPPQTTQPIKPTKSQPSSTDGPSKPTEQTKPSEPTKPTEPTKPSGTDQQLQPEHIPVEVGSDEEEPEEGAVGGAEVTLCKEITLLKKGNDGQLVKMIEGDYRKIHDNEYKARYLLNAKLEQLLYCGEIVYVHRDEIPYPTSFSHNKVVKMIVFRRLNSFMLARKRKGRWMVNVRKIPECIRLYTQNSEGEDVELNEDHYYVDYTPSESFKYTFKQSVNFTKATMNDLTWTKKPTDGRVLACAVTHHGSLMIFFKKYYEAYRKINGEYKIFYGKTERRFVKQ